MNNTNPAQTLFQHKKALSAAILVAAGMVLATEALAREEYAQQLGLGKQCGACHTNNTTGTSGNVKPAAIAAFANGGVVPGLKNFVASNTAPVTVNTKPVLNTVANQWDVAVGEVINIPLVVNDAEDDAFTIVKKSAIPAVATITDGGVDTSTQLPKSDFTWTPLETQKNKIYTLKLAAKETDTTKKYTSNTITTKIRVWPAGDRDNASVKSLIVSTASWKLDVLSLKGKVVPNTIMTPAEKTAFMARTDLTMDIVQGIDKTGTPIATQMPISLKPNGTWTLTQPLVAPFSCHVTLSFEGKDASRKIAKAPTTCIK